MAKISIALVFYIIFCCSTEGAPAENNAESEVQIKEVKDGLFYSMPGQTDRSENMMIIYAEKDKLNSLDPLARSVVSRDFSVLVVTSEKERYRKIEEEMISSDGDYYKYYQEEYMSEKKTIFVMTYQG